MHAEPPHPPAAAGPARSFFQNPLLPQGVGLALLSLLPLLILRVLSRQSALLGLVLGPVLLAVTVLAGWASAIHLTGGERFDDHPWV